jgi:hypothetical protein
MDKINEQVKEMKNKIEELWEDGKNIWDDANIW